jgi:hypothetical protein
VVLFAGLGVLTTALFAATLWKEAVAYYYLARLRAEAEQFLDLAGAKEGTARREALRMYLASAEGRQALLRSFLQCYTQAEPTVRALQFAEKGLIGIKRAGESDGWFWTCFQRAGGETNDLRVIPPRFSQHLERVEALLPEASGPDITLPEHADLHFRFLPRQQAYELYAGTSLPEAVWRGSGRGGKFICFVERRRTKA